MYRLLAALLVFCLLAGASAYAAQPVITGVTIPNVSMKIGDVVTATISVQSDSAATYTLVAGSDIGGYPLENLTKFDSTTYTATFTITEGGTDYAAADDIPVNLTLQDPSDGSGTYTTPISQDSDPIDAHRPAKPATPDLAPGSDTGHYDDDDMTNDDTPTFQGGPGAAEAGSTVTVESSVNGVLGTTVANADGSWSFTSPTLTDGWHDITVTATDAAGNVSDPSDLLPVLIDTQPPDPPGGRSPADGTYTNDTSPTLSWAVPSDPGGSGIYDYRVQIDGPVTRDYYTTNTSYTPSLGSEGTYTWRLYAIDLAGNKSGWAPDWTFIIDTTPPVVASVTPTQLADADVGTVTITVTFNEDMDQSVNPTVTVEALSSSPYATTNPVWIDVRHFTCQFTFNDDGEEAVGHYAISGAQDRAGNAMAPDSSQAVDVDTKNPTITSITSTSPNGYYKQGDSINVTVNFSEPVILSSGGAIAVDLDSGATVSIDPFGPAVSGSTSYTVGAGENSCDLDATGIALSGGTLQDAAGNDAIVGLPGTTIADGSDIVVDTTAPVINGLTVSDETVDDNCQATVTFSATVTDNCCVDAGNVTVTVTLPSGNATLGPPTITKTQVDVDEIYVSGSVLVSDLNGCPATVQVTVDATDCCGNAAAQESVTGDVIDTSAPQISWTIPLPSDIQYVDSACSITIPIDATVTDNCCIAAANVSAHITVTNATVTDTVTVSQVDEKHVRIAGEITVSCLTGCPAVLTVTISGIDCCGNADTWTSSVEIRDNTIPAINDFSFYTDGTYTTPTDDYYVDDCCFTTVYFAANVTDQCCIHPDGITVEVTLPTGNAILENVVVDETEVSECPGRVDITGRADVRCLTGCPARVEIHIEAEDCCGNAAIPVTSTAIEGLVYDVIPPTAIDDPDGDEDRSSSDGLEVRADDYGQYRLMVRQNTPTRIDPIANDTDNCSACTCCGTMWIHEIVEPPQYGTATVEIDHGDCNGGSVIRYAPYRDYLGPDYFTYRIEDACGNVSDIATVYVEVVRQTVMKDLYLSGCTGGGIDFEMRATDIWIDPDDPNTIPFTFSIASLPAHGIILGDPAEVTYTPHGRTTKQIESASIGLTYVPVAGFVGSDALRVRFSDPFGGSSIASVDLIIVGCEPAGSAETLLHRGDVIPIFVPALFTPAYEAGEIGWTVTGPDGSPHPDAISPIWDEGLGVYILLLDTGGLDPGEYAVTIPLGTGEAAQLTLEVNG